MPASGMASASVWHGLRFGLTEGASGLSQRFPGAAVRFTPEDASALVFLTPRARS